MRFPNGKEQHANLIRAELTLCEVCADASPLEQIYIRETIVRVQEIYGMLAREQYWQAQGVST